MSCPHTIRPPGHADADPARCSMCLGAVPRVRHVLATAPDEVVLDALDMPLVDAEASERGRRGGEEAKRRRQARREARESSEQAAARLRRASHRRWGDPAQRLAKIRALADEGHTPIEICRSLSTSRSTVARALRTIREEADRG